MPLVTPWKKWLLLVVVLVATVYALPNWFGEDPAVQISSLEPSETQDQIMAAEQSRILSTLAQKGLPVKSISAEGQQVMVRFADTETQLKAKPILAEMFKGPYSVALNLASAAPVWLQSLGARPMKLGLDLRGGVHFRMKVDLSLLIKRRLEGYQQELIKAFRENRFYYQQSVLEMPRGGQANLPEGELTFVFTQPELRHQAVDWIDKHMLALAPQSPESADQDGSQVYPLRIRLSLPELQRLKNDALEQTLTTLRNRVNELGVSEALVQRQGADGVIVELPGIQDTAYAKNILGKTATVEFLLQDASNELQLLKNPGPVPLGSKWYPTRWGKRALLKKQVVLSGDSIIGASTSMESRFNTPAVDIQVGGSQVASFSDTTAKNVGQRMAVVYVETKSGQSTEQVISMPVIESALGSHFQITGLSQGEARDLALLLRSGSLPAPVDIVEERIVGPSMGQENIQMGMISVGVGLGLVLLFMALYYRGFGLVANLTLFANLVLLLALMSLIGATLTLPGIAGIVLTLGMAVDANVLVFERIREELRLGVPPLSSIHKGFEGAWGTILDSNLTTLIAGLVLFGIGSGPIKGFAVTLCLGILTSLYTAVTGSKVLIHVFLGHKKSLSSLSIGAVIR